MVGYVHQSLTDVVAKYENSAYNKTDNDINAEKIKLFEKKKIPYRMLVIEVHNFDKKVVKRGKKMITNNKYILFNSWYTKNRQSHWLTSHDMWNRMKTHSVSCKQFIDIFDYMEKLGKSIKLPLSSSSSSSSSSSEETSPPPPVANSTNLSDGDEANESAVSTRKKKHDIDAEQIKEGNNQRLRMYEEFYRVLTATFKTNSAPAASFIYDQKLTRAFIESGIQTFKTELSKLDQERNRGDTKSINENTQDIFAKHQHHHYQHKEKIARKLKQSGGPPRKQTKIAAKRADEYAMVNDHVEDSQMSD
ncbi:39k [Hyposidra talaca nucleopolyhedrovirus]|uniref:39k n=1 Tax=Hyposidra talaca nucleopolyhedrovirus TaxID=1070315 RepID=A0A2Z4HHY7_9ABAC|nr:39k [Hyposidra talaca nucleopolyhedrovirus]AWW14393.1 39k [Hyposidra talaca nucleopolyhedrovirus]